MLSGATTELQIILSRFIGNQLIAGWETDLFGYVFRFF